MGQCCGQSNKNQEQNKNIQQTPQQNTQGQTQVANIQKGFQQKDVVFTREKLHLKIANAEKTKVLSLQDMNLSKIPDTCMLQDLQTLDISKNQISRIPSSVENCKALKKFIASRNKFNEFEVKLGSCTKLEKIDLSFNQIEKFDYEILFQNLINLDLSNNQIQIFKIQSQNFPNLESLNLASNKLSVINEQIFILPVCVKIELQSNLIEQLPEDIQNYKLEDINLSFNKLKTIPSCYLEKTSISQLTLTGNQITQQQLNQLPGIQSFLDRRKERKDKQIQGGIQTDTKLCGIQYFAFYLTHIFIYRSIFIYFVNLYTSFQTLISLLQIRRSWQIIRT